MTAGTIQEELREFTVRLLGQAGGLVDWTNAAEEGTALVSGEIATLLHLPQDSFTLATQPGREALCASLATDFLELAEGVLDACVPRIGSFRVPERYLKRGDLQEAVDRSFSWTNARAKVRESRPVSVEYHVWWFHARLRSEDCWETLVCAKLNSLSRGEVDLPDPLELGDLAEVFLSEGPIPETLSPAAACAQRNVFNAARPFLERMDARRQRDQKRLHEYYGSLRRQATSPKRRSKAPPAPDEIETRSRAVQLELRRKLGELDERYAIDAVLRPLVLVRLESPVLAIDLEVQRKQARRLHTLYWNSLTKQFEPLVCSACGRSTYLTTVTNETVEILCGPCASGLRGAQPPETS
ncbi:MAG TPA: hypothetical protein VMR25_21190 [Planctomycetaceae bacterium]|jgi:hypothetical protein|nr:hypothetical protein [Planctomycetaceae bacterium]